MARKILLIVVFVEAAGLLLWFCWRPGLFGTPLYWAAVCGWVVFVAAVAALSHNWRREESSDVRGFEVLPHDKQPR